MSDVVMLSKYQIVAGEDPDVTSTKLHLKKNKAVNPADEAGVEFPPYRFTPYPTAMYRDWDDPDDRENEIYRLAAKGSYDLEKRRDRMTVEALVGKYKTCNVGMIDFVRHPDRDEVISELRERNDREHAARLEEGWADTPDGVPAAKRRYDMRVSSLPSAQIIYEDRHLSEKAKAEFDAVNDAADDHVVDVDGTRKQLRDAGKLPKERK